MAKHLVEGAQMHFSPPGTVWKRLVPAGVSHLCHLVVRAQSGIVKNVKFRVYAMAIGPLDKTGMFVVFPKPFFTSSPLSPLICSLVLKRERYNFFWYIPFTPNLTQVFTSSQENWKKMPGEAKQVLLPDFILLERPQWLIKNPVSQTALLVPFYLYRRVSPSCPSCAMPCTTPKWSWSPKQDRWFTSQWQLFFWWCNTRNFNSPLEHFSELTAQNMLAWKAVAASLINLWSLK